MIRIITMLSLISAVFCQYPRQRAPQPIHNQPLPRQQPQPMYEDDIEDYRPQPKNNVVHQPAPVHYVNIGAELAGDYKFGYDTGKGNDGQSFREETRLPDGSVQGAYGYTDETGKQHIVKYTAGKEGFKVIKDSESNTESKPASRSAPVPRQTAPQRAFSQPEVHQQAYRPAPSQQAYRPAPQQAYRPPQPAQPVAYNPPSQPAYRAPQPQSSNRAAPVPQRYVPEPQAYVPEPQRYAPEPQRYAPEPQRYAPEPQRYAPEPQRYAPEPQSYAPRSRSSSHESKARYTPVPVSRSEDDESDYDYPDNDITERRLAPIDTSLLNYNIGTSNGARV